MKLKDEAFRYSKDQRHFIDTGRSLIWILLHLIFHGQSVSFLSLSPLFEIRHKHILILGPTLVLLYIFIPCAHTIQKSSGHMRLVTQAGNGQEVRSDCKYRRSRLWQPSQRLSFAAEKQLLCGGGCLGSIPANIFLVFWSN